MTTTKTLHKQEALTFLSPLYQQHIKEVFGKRRRLILIAGPTGVGKTEIGISIAKILGGEIISADSMQVYRGMDIGTAKPSIEQRKEVPHHLIDIRDINEPFNVVEFYKEAHKACRDIFIRQKVPIVVGGCGFYIHAFLYGPPEGPPSDPLVRKQLQEQMDKMGAEVLYEKLQILDPEYAATITEKDQHKIIRALEIITISKRLVSSFVVPRASKHTVYDSRLFFIDLPKEILYEKIDKRCIEMVDKGLIEEVRKLKEMGIEQNPSASQAIGYRQCLKYLQSAQTGEDRLHFLEDFKKASKRYIKRQITWFKKQSFFRWLNLNEMERERVEEMILQDYEQGD